MEDSAACPGRCDIPISYSVDPAFSDDEQAIIAEAASTWERGTQGRVCFQRQKQGGGELEFIRLERQSDLRMQDAEWQHHVALCKGSRIWIVPSKVDERGEYVALVIHEIGHRLGLSHIEDAPDTYMHSTINDTPHLLWEKFDLPERDRREFCAVHGCTCSP